MAYTALGEEAKKHFEEMYGRTFATSEELFAFGITQRLGLVKMFDGLRIYKVD